MFVISTISKYSKMNTHDFNKQESYMLLFILKPAVGCSYAILKVYAYYWLKCVTGFITDK